MWKKIQLFYISGDKYFLPTCGTWRQFNTFWKSYIPITWSRFYIGNMGKRNRNYSDNGQFRQVLLTRRFFSKSYIHFQPCEMKICNYIPKDPTKNNRPTRTPPPVHKTSTNKIHLLQYRDLRETIESCPLCITDLFQNQSVAYF